MEYQERRAPLINVFMMLGRELDALGHRGDVHVTLSAGAWDKLNDAVERMTGRKCPAGDIEIDIATPCGYVKVFKGSEP